jgi:hypothetical protein
MALLGGVPVASAQTAPAEDKPAQAKPAESPAPKEDLTRWRYYKVIKIDTSPSGGNVKREVRTSRWR